MTKIIKILFKAPPYAYTLVIGLAICYLTLVPRPLPTVSFKLFPHFDKVAHFLMFAALSGAVLFDRTRIKGTAPTFFRVAIAMVLSILDGGVIELLQERMGLGRSADILDFIADALGAICGAVIVAKLNILSRPVIGTVGKVSLAPFTICPESLEAVKEIYLSSFPEEERRPWTDIVSMASSSGDPFNFYIIMCGNNPVGLLSTWIFDSFIYVEHFAVNESCRGNGIGNKVLKHLISTSSLPIVLEVELPSTGETALRRIDFYSRNGFYPLSDYQYIQPPYQPHLPEVELMLMSTDTKINPDEVALTLHREVYGVLQ